jgi:DNA-directed RNA polymerase specialized sigma24 family protein
MPIQTDMKALPLADLAQRCARETELFFQGQSNDTGYCFELFRRALRDDDQHAWSRVYNQYRPLVTGWVKQHTAFYASGEEAQYFVNRAFEKMWGAMTPAKFSHFSNLKSLLSYMQACVHSVIVDHVRASRRSALVLLIEGLADEDRVRGVFVENRALAQVYRQEVWKEVSARLHNEEERLVVYCTFILALKPREIQARYPETFHNVSDVYRVKENVLSRLRRDIELKKFLVDDA